MYRPSGGGGMPSLFKSSQGIGRLVMDEKYVTSAPVFKPRLVEFKGQALPNHIAESEPK